MQSQLVSFQVYTRNYCILHYEKDKWFDGPEVISKGCENDSNLLSVILKEFSNMLVAGKRKLVLRT